MRSLLNRRLGLLGTVIFLAVAIAVIVVVAQFLPSKGDESERTAATPTATAEATPCQELDPPYGTPPQDFDYVPVAEDKRAQTVKALRLDEAEGKVDVRDVQQSSSKLNLGSLVGVPSKDPIDYASRLIASSQATGSEVQRAGRYALIPLQSGKQIAVGVKGCRTVMITAADPEAVKFLASAVFSD
ncbi:hypothetical protein [Solirubrobacter pauli]|uniref:hypothetical protein n=1 Tax=Solirubrobacter pauli TaxID=166793 RepID=UPI000EB5AA19|nr:hypothetical protein [Solirubrobacter pauli]